MTHIEQIRALLTTGFSPTQLDIIDESHLHAGHAGNKQGGGHYRLMIISDAFAGKSPIQRHRMVHEVLGSLMKTGIHALSISARTPTEVSI